MILPSSGESGEGGVITGFLEKPGDPGDGETLDPPASCLSLWE